MKQRVKLLLVEDELLIAYAEKIKLERHGFHVHHARTGKSAIDIINKNDVDLILMDIDLGKGINGIETAKKVRENHDIPILFMTSHYYSEIHDDIKPIKNSKLLSGKDVSAETARDINDIISGNN